MQARLEKVSDLTPEMRDQMFELFQTHFDGVDRALFARDLDEKNWAVLIVDEETGQKILGFSSLHFYPTQFRGETLSVVYSGDTIMDPSAWTSTILSRSWLSSVVHLHQKEAPETRCFWLLISSGFRTYRFLPTFWQDFLPRHDGSPSEDLLALRDHLARERFGEIYDSERGLVRFPQAQVLRDELSGIPERRLRDPHIRFFQEQNPGHSQGDELVCLTEVRVDNLTRAGRKILFVEDPETPRQAPGSKV